MHDGNLDEAVAAYRKAVQAAPDNPNYKIALQRAVCRGVAGTSGEGARIRTAGPAGGSARRVQGLERVRPEQPGRDREGCPSWIARFAIGSKPPAQAADPGIARARPRRVRRADSQPRVARAAHLPVHEREPSRHPRRHRERHRHQHQLRPRRRRSRDERGARQPDARAGAEPDHDDESALIQSDERSFDLRLPRHRAQARTVRRTGRPHVLPVARRRHRGVADSQHDHPAAGIAVQPAIVANKTANTLTVRGTSSVVQILEKIIEQNDKPRAEIVLDVEILEVDRSRAKNYRSHLSEYNLARSSPRKSRPARRQRHPPRATGRRPRPGPRPRPTRARRRRRAA